MKSVNNDRYAAIALRCLYSKPIGTPVSNVAALKALCKPRLDEVEDRLLANIVGEGSRTWAHHVHPRRSSWTSSRSF